MRHLGLSQYVAVWPKLESSAENQGGGSDSSRFTPSVCCCYYFTSPHVYCFLSTSTDCTPAHGLCSSPEWEPTVSASLCLHLSPLHLKLMNILDPQPSSWRLSRSVTFMRGETECKTRNQQHLWTNS